MIWVEHRAPSTFIYSRRVYQHIAIEYKWHRTRGCAFVIIKAVGRTTYVRLPIAIECDTAQRPSTRLKIDNVPSLSIVRKPGSNHIVHFEVLNNLAVSIAHQKTRRFGSRWNQQPIRACVGVPAITRGDDSTINRYVPLQRSRTYVYTGKSRCRCKFMRGDPNIGISIKDGKIG